VAEPTTQFTPSDDPYAAAMSATERPRGPFTTFIEITYVDVWFCVLRRGQGKVPYDAMQHDISERRTVISIGGAPLKGAYDVKQETIDFEKAWATITLPSLKALGQDLRTLKGKYAKITRKPVGETYTNKAGEEKERTGLHFEAIYQTRQEAEAAAEALFGTRERRVPDPVAAQEAVADLSPQQPAQPGMPREQAWSFVTMLWTSQRNPETLKTFLATSPCGQHFPFESPDVQRLIAGQ